MTLSTKSERAAMKHQRLVHGLSCVLAMVVAGAVGTGCATLHSAQVGDVDSQTVLTGERFEIKLVELGVDIEEAGEIARDLSKYTKREEETDTIVDIIKMANSGPTTGYPVFDVKYSDTLIDKLKSACPSGKVSGLTSVRETADYGLVSGEIVKLIGYCAKGE